MKIHFRFLNALALCLAAPALTSLAPPVAAAQVVVHDPANHAENLLAAARMLEQIEHQIAALEQQAQMLARGKLQLSPDLARTIDEAEALFRRGEGLSHDIARIGGEIEVLYPETWDAYELEGVLDQSGLWAEESRRSLARAMAAQAQAAAGLGATRTRLGEALAASQGAEGQTSAVQAGNQLLGLSAAQLAGIEALMIAEGRALQAERMERLAREARAEEIRARAFPETRREAPPPARRAF
jgi:P-type conjugative transfer protein TrbJ